MSNDTDTNITFNQWTESRVAGTHEWEWCGDGVGVQTKMFAPLTNVDAANAWDVYVEDWAAEADEPMEYRIVTVRYADGDAATVVDDVAVGATDTDVA